LYKRVTSARLEYKLTARILLSKTDWSSMAPVGSNVGGLSVVMEEREGI
jgi:hypothetical protein